MLKDYLKTHSVTDLKQFFAKNHLKPFALNSIENINFRTSRQWEDTVELFTFGCKIASEIGNPYMIVVPTVTDTVCTKTEKEVFDDSVKVLKELSDIAKPYGTKLSFEPIGDRR
jgi:2-keto-myo-inositol isomerase